MSPHNEQPKAAVSQEAVLRFLQITARLLLQYNFRSELIIRKIDRGASPGH